jgi:hypothetical protein
MRLNPPVSFREAQYTRGLRSGIHLHNSTGRKRKVSLRRYCGPQPDADLKGEPAIVCSAIIVANLRLFDFWVSPAGILYRLSRSSM